MTRLFLISFFLLTIVATIGQTIPKDGAIRFNFIDTNKEEIVYFNITIIYDDSIKTNIFSDPAKGWPIVKVKPGIHTFQIKTAEYKEVIISDIEISSDKMLFLTTTLIPKVLKTRNDTIKIKWQKPTIDPDRPQE